MSLFCEMLAEWCWLLVGAVSDQVASRTKLHLCSVGDHVLFCFQWTHTCSTEARINGTTRIFKAALLGLGTRKCARKRGHTRVLDPRAAMHLSFLQPKPLFTEKESLISNTICFHPLFLRYLIWPHLLVSLFFSLLQHIFCLISSHVSLTNMNAVDCRLAASPLSGVDERHECAVSLLERNTRWWFWLGPPSQTPMWRTSGRLQISFSLLPVCGVFNVPAGLWTFDARHWMAKSVWTARFIHLGASWCTALELPLPYKAEMVWMYIFPPFQGISYVENCTTFQREKGNCCRGH